MHFKCGTKLGVCFEYALLVMCPHVAALRKCQPALLTGVRLKSRVEVHVGLQMVLFREALGAHAACVGLHTLNKTQKNVFIYLSETTGHNDVLSTSPPIDSFYLRYTPYIP